MHKSIPEFEIGRAIKVREGGDATIIVGGGLLQNAMAAADILASDHKIETRVLSMHTLKPFDDDAARAAARETGAVFTLEEHSIIGGLGGAVAESLLESDARPRIFKRIGLPGVKFSSKVGDQDYLRNEFGLDAASVARSIAAAITSH